MNEEVKDISYDAIRVGDEASFGVTITEKMVDEFAAFSGDRNPLHTSEAYAAQTPMKHRIAHGALVEALFSRLIGTYLPGRHSLYLSQDLRFHEPIMLGTAMIIRGRVAHKTDAHQAVSMEMTAEDERTKKILVSGDAMVRLLK